MTTKVAPIKPRPTTNYLLPAAYNRAATTPRNPRPTAGWISPAAAPAEMLADGLEAGVAATDVLTDAAGVVDAVRVVRAVVAATAAVDTSLVAAVTTGGPPWMPEMEGTTAADAGTDAAEDSGAAEAGTGAAGCEVTTAGWDVTTAG